MSTKKPDKSLREMLDEFETIVTWFNGDDLDVETATAKFEEGAKLAEQIKQRLNEAKNKITIVQEKFETTDLSTDPE
ncbi:exodeoxyribonuclease VII small subunit [Candidatus Saccharibacteria bacterium]|nr:exodeoxyribonuclease VII small subunit [Candidatus Saccharibacteria bacterium]